LATHDIDFSNPQEKGLLYDDFENLLDGIPARQKLLFVDACHSGEVDKDETEVKPQEAFVAVTMTKSGNTNVTQKTVGMQNSFELMRELFTDLRRSTGATVISAAGGTQFAYEGTNGLKNGVFTNCIKEGLNNKAADLNKDGKVLLSELQQYVAEQVVLLTGGKQQPTSRIENLVNDFRVR
jgi:Caspase domain